MKIVVCIIVLLTTVAHTAPSRTIEPRDDSLILNLPTISPISLNLPPVTPISIRPISIPAVSIPPVSLNLPAQCTPTVKPDENGYIPAGECGANWNYSPSFTAALVFALLFLATLIIHTIQAIVYKNTYCWVVCMAATWELIAYISRTLGSRNQQSLALATISQITVLVSPVWVNAFAYMVFARIVHIYSPTGKVWMFTASSLAMIFVTLDIIAFIIQLVGGGMAGPGSDAETAKRGLNIYMMGIGIQEAFVVMFSLLIIKFVHEKVAMERRGTLGRNGSWRRLIYALCACLVLISTRIVFRLVEFSGGMGRDNQVPYNEKLFYVFEAVPMLLAIFVWNAVHPGCFISGAESKLPRSWLGQKVCVCRRRKGRNVRGNQKDDHIRLVKT